MTESPNSVAVVTGGASGIGYAVARRLTVSGMTVVIIDADESGLGESADRLGAETGRRPTIVHADLLDEDQLKHAVVRAAAAADRIDVLVNNVGGSAGSPVSIDHVDHDQYALVTGLNMGTTFFTIKEALPHLRASRGCIVNVASIGGRQGIATISAQYSAAKGAVLALTRNLAMQLGPDGIRVNAVAPGYVRSGPRVDAIWNSRDSAKIIDTIALRRRAEPDEIAAVVDFLASSAASYVTGATIDVNGGLFAM